MAESLAEVRSRIEALGMNFEFTGTIKTSMNGIERETWLMEYEGSQFVYVAGQKNVVLGWDTQQCPLGEGILEDLRDEFEAGHEYYQEEIDDVQADYENELAKAAAAGDAQKQKELIALRESDLQGIKEDRDEGGYDSWENFMTKWNGQLRQCMSPLRTADIGDMIVEIDNQYLRKDAPSLAEAVCSLKEGPFTLATEDEWEYLCNGGTRTLFRWGDTLTDVIEDVYNVGIVSKDQEETSSLLNQPNMLGLYIGYNSYQMEIIDNTLYTKGGDGGGSLCGGDGAAYVLPCYTAFYRQPVSDNDHKLSKHYYVYRRIIRLT